MDVSKQLADYAAAQYVVPLGSTDTRTGDVLERATPVEIDAGLLAAYDTTPVDASEYEYVYRAAMYLTSGRTGKNTCSH